MFQKLTISQNQPIQKTATKLAPQEEVCPVEDEELEMLIHDTTGGAPEETPIKSLEVTEAVALDPEKWAMCITTTSDVTRLEMYLRNAFANVLSHRKWKYVASDCVNTLSAMAYMMLLFSRSLCCSRPCR